MRKSLSDLRVLEIGSGNGQFTQQLAKNIFVDEYKAEEKTVSSFFTNVNLVIDKLNVRKSGYRIISNSGLDGGQEVPHFHIHILAGEKIGALR